MDNHRRKTDNKKFASCGDATTINAGVPQDD
jgi:hypothetical protein